MPSRYPRRERVAAACVMVALLLAGSAQARPLIGAHRGLSAGVPENTLTAFRRSIQNGVAMIEVDVRATSDGHLVILHDGTVDRTTNCSGRVADLTLTRLKSCNAGLPGGPGDRVPTLAEALELIKPTPARLLLDIKPGTSLDDVIREIRAHRAQAKVVVGLRKSEQVARARDALPETTLLAFLPALADAATFAKAGSNAIRLWSDWVEADPSQVSRMRALGPEVWIMVGRGLPRADDEWRALHNRMLLAGPDAMITDRPELVPPTKAE